MTTTTNSLRKVTVSTDGSCIAQGMPHAKAGWGFIVRGSLFKKSMGHVPGLQDSNRAEAYAVLQALKFLQENINQIDEIHIRTDSESTRDGFLSHKVRVHNHDIWNQVIDILPDVVSKIKSLKHVYRDKNTKADELATRAANTLIFLDDEGNNLSFGQ